MRVADNTIKGLRNYFEQTLNGCYEPGEISALFELATAHYLKTDRLRVASNPQRRVNQSELLDIYDCAKLLAKQIPLQYIIGETFFYGMTLKTAPGILIPRPETEELVDLIVRQNKSAPNALDVGTGSGCIALGLKKALPGATVTACDVSTEALTIAEENARLNTLQINFMLADVLNETDFNNKIRSASFDLIVSNPPYILRSEMDSMPKNVTMHEPHLALFVNGTDPILFYRKIVELCKNALNTGGRLYFELNPLTADQVLDLAKASGFFSEQELIKDMSGNVRFLAAKKR